MHICMKQVNIQGMVLVVNTSQYASVVLPGGPFCDHIIYGLLDLLPQALVRRVSSFNHNSERDPSGTQ